MDVQPTKQKNSTMSVTILNEIEKAEVLVSGLKKNLNEVKEIGVDAEGLKKLEELSELLRKKDEDLDLLRRQVSLKSKENRELLADLKVQMLTYRKAVKSRYIQAEWIKYGVQDKR